VLVVGWRGRGLRRKYLDMMSMAPTYHAQTHAFVRVDEVGKNLRGRGDGDAALVSELVQTALHAQIREPVLAVLYTQPVSEALIF